LGLSPKIIPANRVGNATASGYVNFRIGKSRAHLDFLQGRVSFGHDNDLFGTDSFNLGL
jgi:hypothetical protein